MEPKLTEQIEDNFAEIHPLMSKPEALLEANRCLYCYDAPCTRACPTHIDVPAFIKKIASGNLDGASRVIFDANPIGSSCAKVCPVDVLCEGACVEKTLVKKPIEIGRLQRYATEHTLRSGKTLFEKGVGNGRSVGIVGSGPAGLSCASYLARLGYDVTVYEKRPLAGGLDTYGMAEYKMTQAHSLAEVAQIERLGVKFRVDTEVVAIADGEDPAKVTIGYRTTPSQTTTDAHDAVFLGVGLGKTNRLGIPGEDLDGVIDALRFIYKVKTRDWATVPLGRSVVVLGGGNTAIDAATQAKRLGAERSTLAYRKTEKEAPAYDYEFGLARRDGIEFVWQASPVEIVGDGEVTGIRFRKPDGSEFQIECDLVIKAIGQEKQAEFFRKLGLATDEKGRVSVSDSMQTSNPRIFAAGDCVNGGKEAVDAAQGGKLAAQSIHRSLTGETVRFAGG
ncbi:MAG: NAD(P)-dependent oxidoreductase [Acidobacteria bacterium]|nr:NAD(P)-dependent oxidoreductase [Acidobacteriota bacterium]MBK8813762.1 NAD(P)-dependent oxidoreductase [Acidobacteriota bacterium]